MTSFENTAIFMKSFREKSGLTQRGLIKEVSPHMSSQAVSNFERALCAPPNHFIKKITKHKTLKNLFDKVGYIQAYAQDGYDSSRLTIEKDLK